MFSASILFWTYNGYFILLCTLNENQNTTWDDLSSWQKDSDREHQVYIYVFKIINAEFFLSFFFQVWIATLLLAVPSSQPAIFGRTASFDEEYVTSVLRPHPFWEDARVPTILSLWPTRQWFVNVISKSNFMTKQHFIAKSWIHTAHLVGNKDNV